MPSACCAPGCTNRFLKGVIQMFRIPTSDAERFDRWVKKINRLPLKGQKSSRSDGLWEPNDTHRLCSSHFVTGKPSLDPLHVDYIPTIFQHTPVRKRAPSVLQQKLQRQDRAGTRQENKERSAAAAALMALSEDKENQVPGVEVQASPNMVDGSTQTDTSGSDLELAINMWHEQYRMITSQSNLLEDSLSVIHDLQERVFSLSKSLEEIETKNTELERANRALSEKVNNLFGHKFIENSDTKTSYYTGFPNYETFRVVFEKASKHVKRKNTKLSLQDEMFLALIKLRQNPGMEDLSYRFGISVSLVTKIFHIWLDALYQVLSGLIIWPSTDFVEMPDAFSNDRFSKVKCIIDCTEIFIERPNGLKARAQTYSNYKKHNTVKFLIGVSPSGCVTFVSKCWGGRVSDKKLTMESGFMEKLLPGDVVLADRGFTMRDEFAMKGARLIVPSFTKGKKQLSPQEVEESRQMSRARIHVERIIGRTKDFRILRETMPIALIKKRNSYHPTCEKIMTVVGGVVNTNPPLL